MKYAPRKVFIIENGGYIELSYEEFSRRKNADKSYEDKLFLPVQGCLIESDREHYAEFYRDKERWRYLMKLDRDAALLSIDAFDREGDNGADFISDETEDIAEAVAHTMLLDKLRDSIFLLSEDEQLLICRHYYDGISETKLADIYGISQQAISKRIRKIRAKLKEMIEN